MTIDHIALAVPCLEEAAAQWELLFGYRPNTEPVLNTRQKVHVLFLSKKNSLTVKLIAPSDADSPLYRAARSGGLHHVCFRCSDVANTVALLQRQGARLLVPPQPGEAFENAAIAFLWGGHLNFELIDTERKLGWRKPEPIVNTLGAATATRE